MPTIGFNKELVFTSDPSIPNNASDNGANIYVGEPFNDRLGFNFEGISTYIETTLDIDATVDGRIELIFGHGGISLADIITNQAPFLSVQAESPGGNYKAKVFQDSYMILPNINTIPGHRILFISWDLNANTGTAGIKGVGSTYVTNTLTAFPFATSGIKFGSNWTADANFFEGNMYGFKYWKNKDALGNPDQAFEIDDGTDILNNSGAIGTSTAEIKNKTSSDWSIFTRTTRIDKEFLLTSALNVDGEAHYEGNWSPALLYGDRCYFGHESGVGDYRDTKDTGMRTLNFRISNCLGDAPVVDVVQNEKTVNAFVENINYLDLTYNGVYEGSTSDVCGTVNIIEDVTNSLITFAASADNRIIVNSTTGDYTANYAIPFEERTSSAFIDVTYSAAVDESLFAPYSINGIRRPDYNTIVPSVGSLAEEVIANMDAMIIGAIGGSIASHALYSSITDPNDPNLPALPVGLSATLNVNRMYSAYDFSGCSFMYWNTNANGGAGLWETSIDHTMLNARISISSDHSNAAIGDSVVFRRTDGSFQTATVLDLGRVNSAGGSNNDSITVTYFDQDITGVSYFKLVPSDFDDYAPTALLTNQKTPYRFNYIFPYFFLGTIDSSETSNQVSSLYNSWAQIRGMTTSSVYKYNCNKATLPQYSTFTTEQHGGSDSSCPYFFLADVGFGVEPIVFGMAMTFTELQSIHPHLAEIEALIEEMVPGGAYAPTIADLSAYTSYI